jgi:hypothetical protein
MTKDLINIINNNIQYLKNCLDLTEAHITWGTKDIKNKYSQIKERLLNKINEEKVYLNLYTNKVKEEVVINDEENEYKQIISRLSVGYGH